MAVETVCRERDIKWLEAKHATGFQFQHNNGEEGIACWDYTADESQYGEEGFANKYIKASGSQYDVRDDGRNEGVEIKVCQRD